MDLEKAYDKVDRDAIRKMVQFVESAVLAEEPGSSKERGECGKGGTETG